MAKSQVDISAGLEAKTFLASEQRPVPVNIFYISCSRMAQQVPYVLLVLLNYLAVR